MARQQTKAHGRRAANDASEMIDETAGQASRAAEMAHDAVGRSVEQLRQGMQQGLAAGSRQFGAMGEQAFQSWMHTSNETLQRVLELNVELASWGREQLDDSIGAVRSLSQCRSFGDAYGVQLGLMRSSMENSLRHANKVLSLTANVLSAGTRATSRPD
jgi:hypothetical protein